MSTEVTLPLNLLPAELNVSVFYQLPFKTLILCTLVSKVWKSFIENLEMFFQQQCLQQKKPEDSWFAHASNLHKQTYYIIKALQNVLNDTTWGQCVTFFSSGKMAFYKENGHNSCYLWNMEKEELLDDELKFRDPFSQPYAMDFPYVLTLCEDNILISNVGNNLSRVATIPFENLQGDVSIKGNAVVWHDENTIFLVRDFFKNTISEKILYPKPDNEKKDQNDVFYKISACIFHDNFLICGIDDGVIRIVELDTNQFYDLDPKKLDPKVSVSLPRGEVLYFVADGNLLVSYHKETTGTGNETTIIRVWDLHLRTLVRILKDTDLPQFPRSDFAGHLLILNVAIYVKIIDVFTEKVIKVETDISTFIPTLAFYKNKIFKVNSSLSLEKMIDYNKKAI